MMILDWMETLDWIEKGELVFHVDDSEESNDHMTKNNQ